MPTLRQTVDVAPDPLRGRLDLTVADIGVAQRHSRLPVAQQARDDRERNAPQDCMRGVRLTVIPAKGPSTNYRIGNCRILDGASPLFLAGRQLVISVDARKKGLVGEFSNGGR